MTKSERWILSEFLVARDRVERFHDSLIYHRQFTPYAEVDLIFGHRSRDGRPHLTMIEVKSVSGPIWASEVISRKQKLRLERARLWVEDEAQRPTSLWLATVNAAKNEIHYFEAPF